MDQKALNGLYSTKAPDRHPLVIYDSTTGHLGHGGTGWGPLRDEGGVIAWSLVSDIKQSGNLPLGEEVVLCCRGRSRRE